MPLHRLAVIALALLLAACATPLAPLLNADPGEARLVGFARLPAATYRPAPESGRQIGDGVMNGISVPFRSGQPVQGLSGLVPDGSAYIALADNGFGNRQNSRDSLLRLYRIDIDFRTAEGGPGKVKVQRVIDLTDPRFHAGFPIQRGKASDRRLTGADFDPEAIVRMPDGSYWLGEEFGPFLLHVDNDGRLLEAPVPLPDPDHPGELLKSPDHPSLRGLADASAQARVRRSGGIEALGLFPDERHLLVSLEKPLRDATRPETLMLEFDCDEGRFTGRVWHYLLAPGTDSIGDIDMVSEDIGLSLVHNGPRGTGLRWVERFHLSEDGRIDHAPVADLGNLADPDRLGPAWPNTRPGRFHWPFTALEDLVFLAPDRLIVGNDNNFPYGIVRQRRQRRPDDSEFLLIELGQRPRTGDGR